MASISRVGADTAGGVIVGLGQQLVNINGKWVSLDGDRVAPHGRRKHRNPTMIAGSKILFINGIRAVKQGDAATCGHTATGSAWVDEK